MSETENWMSEALPKLEVNWISGFQRLEVSFLSSQKISTVHCPVEYWLMKEATLEVWKVSAGLAGTGVFLMKI